LNVNDVFRRELTSEFMGNERQGEARWNIVRSADANGSTTLMRAGILGEIGRQGILPARCPEEADMRTMRHRIFWMIIVGVPLALIQLSNFSFAFVHF
jgi:hypothetical protein